jgi:Family of unknown function (DUF6510)
MDPLDGNSIGGLLYDVFGEEMTAVMATCATCGAIAAVAEGVVYPRLPGTIVRCRSCCGLLMAITEVHGIYCADLRGIAALDAPAGT